MKPALRTPAVFVLALSVTLALPGETAAAPGKAADLYAEAFELLKIEFDAPEWSILFGGEEGELSEQARERIEQGLDELARAAAAETVAWPVDWDSDWLFPAFGYVGRARDAVRVTTWYAKEIGREDPAAALDLLETSLAVSGHVSQDGMLIHLLSSIALEGIAWSAAEELAGEWEKRHRQRLLEIVQSQTPEFSLADAVAREAQYSLNRFSEALFSAPDSASLTDLVRISSIAILPGETWIAMEHAGLGVSFHLKPGETRHGIELVSFDRENNRAVIRSEDEEAVVHLESRRIEPINPAAFLRLMGIEADGEVARRLTQDVEEPEETEWLAFEPADLTDILTGEESDAEVALILFHEMNAGYELMASFASAPFGTLPTDRRRDAHPIYGATDPEADPRDGFNFPEGTSAFAAEIASSILRMRQHIGRGQTHRNMLGTALRLFDDPDSPIPDDPFSPDGDEPLIVSRGDDWVEVRSRFEMSGDRTHSVRVER